MYQMSDTNNNPNTSKEADQKSLENMMEAVVSITGGEVALKGGHTGKLVENVGGVSRLAN